MNILNVLYTIIISPIEMIIEAIFCLVMSRAPGMGAAGAIIAVSLAVNFLTLPIYNVADAIQKRERDIQARLSHWVKHIKTHFTGDERFMMLSYYYKQKGYHPLYALRSSLSIMIEVPFFIAAYHFLSHCPALQNVSCGAIANLGKPDGLITIPAFWGGGLLSASKGGAPFLSLNLLPILMTVINVISASVYLKGFALREKVQTYGLAVIFLILLYNSPSGLVLYWTLNNVFSLCKNVISFKPSLHLRLRSTPLGCALTRLLQTAGEKRVVAVHVAGFLSLSFGVLMLIVYRVSSHGTLGIFRTAVFMLSIVWAAYPFTRKALKGDGKAYIVHAFVALLPVASFVLLCVSRLASNGNPGKFRTLCLISSFAFMAFPIEKQALQGGQKAMRAHLAVSGALTLWALLLCITSVAAYGHAGAFRVGLLLVSASWMASVPVMSQQKGLQRLEPSRNDGGLPLFLSSCAGLALLLGVVLPSSAISTSPVEFSFIGGIASPLYYVGYSLCVFAGLFVLWPLVIYKMFSGKTRHIMPYLAAFLFITALLNAYPFGFNYGNMDNMFRLDDAKVLLNKKAFYTVLPFAASLAVAFLLFIAYKKGVTRYINILCTVLVIAELLLSTGKVHKIAKGFENAAEEKRKEATAVGGKLEPIYHLSKNGKNVVVLFLDRAISSFFPYIVRQFPQLAQEFDGFVYYPNTVSFAGQTSKASPALMGGYEYTPENANKRPDVLLVEKHNEAVLLMPRLFLDAGYAVTVTDPPNCNYKWTGDLTPFEPYPNMKCDCVEAKYGKRYKIEAELNKQVQGASIVIASHTVNFAIMQIMPPAVRKIVYNKGRYFSDANLYFNYNCLKEFAFMYYLKDLTDCDAKGDTYTFIENSLTHQATILSEPGYVLSVNGVDLSRATAGFYKWKVGPEEGGDNISDLAHYHVNAAAMLQTAKWLNKLKRMGVYNNTRIIIVADHGHGNHPVPAFINIKHGLSYAFFNPLLLVKDFDAHGNVRTDNAFMTNADTIIFAKQGLPVSDINPFTGKSISAAVDKKEARIYPTLWTKSFNESTSLDQLRKKKLWVLDKRCGPLRVHDNIFDENNWEEWEGIDQ